MGLFGKIVSTAIAGRANAQFMNGNDLGARGHYERGSRQLQKADRNYQRAERVAQHSKKGR
jgi:hypothetical protein